MADDALLRDEIRLLGELLGDVLREQAGDKAFDLVEEVRALAKERRAGEPDAEKALVRRVEACDGPALFSLTQALSMFFDLANLAEDRHRARVLREWDREGRPRPDSLSEVVDVMARGGATAEDVRALLERVRIELVFTAHPTEAKRRSVREKVRDLRAHLRSLDEFGLTLNDRADCLRAIRADLTGLWQTDFVRFRRPTVLEELDRSLFFAGNLWQVAPRLYRELRNALRRVWADEDFEIPALLRFDTWIGGDRDGNPYVTAEVTRQALRTLRREAIRRHVEQASLAQRNLSVSSRKAGVDDALLEAIEAALDRWPALREATDHLSAAEPYRRWMEIVRWRLRRAGEADLSEAAPEGAYTDLASLVADLELARTSLRNNGGALIAELHLDDWICQSRVFGLHLMRLDVRQESSWYHGVIGELLALAGLCDDYGDLDEAGRVRALREAMDWASRLRVREPADASSEGLSDPFEAEGLELSENTREALALFRLLARVTSVSGPESLGVHVISMTHQASDVLAVLWLSRWAAVREGLPDGRLPMPIAPLFETIDDLRRAPEVIESMLADEVYAAHVNALGSRQVVMIGYSDSTKDGGYLAACWGLHDAQQKIHDAASAHDVRAIFFHGRGGSLGRGGGPAARAIRSLPVQTVDHGLRVTEQGEVLSERYDDPRIAHRHLEQVVSATLRRAWEAGSTAGPAASRAKETPGSQGPSVEHLEHEVLPDLAKEAHRAYRALVEEPGFITYFEQATPITQIEQLPIGSRPSRRRSERTLETLRAIPWVFSWTQCRHMLPAWYGLGTAVERYTSETPDGLETLRGLYARSPFFRALVDNASLALAKADMGIARHHASLVEDEGTRRRIWEMIHAEHTRSSEAVRSILRTEALLDEVPWLKRSIDVRNPYVDPLNMIQAELFRRIRRVEADSPEGETLASQIRLTIQGIAGGLRTTG